MTTRPWERPKYAGLIKGLGLWRTDVGYDPTVVSYAPHQCGWLLIDKSDCGIEIWEDPAGQRCAHDAGRMGPLALFKKKKETPDG